jgi:hypothetical protein
LFHSTPNSFDFIPTHYENAKWKISRTPQIMGGRVVFHPEHMTLNFLPTGAARK